MRLPEVGDWFQIHINQGFRNAEVLATIGDDALIEYHMPAGSTALRVIERSDPYGSEFEPRRNIKNVSYFNLPKKWSQAMKAADSTWLGLPQQHLSVKGPVPLPY